MTALCVHPLDPQSVAEAVRRRVATIEAARQRDYANLDKTLASYARTLAEGKPWRGGPVPRAEKKGELESYYDQQVHQEQTYYAQVRVVEDPAQLPKPFFLVYGATPNEGPHRTGGFASAAEAEGWFMQLGR
jgi:hypothetical protein